MGRILFEFFAFIFSGRYHRIVGVNLKSVWKNTVKVGVNRPLL